MPKRVSLLVTLLYLLALAGLVTLRGAVLALSVPFVLYLLFALWQAPAQVKLEVRRRLNSERVAPDAPVQVTVNIHNSGSGLKNVLVEDLLPPGLKILEGSNRHLLNLAAGQSFSWTYTVSGLRGYYVFTALEAEASDLFGLLHRKESFSLQNQVFVLPPVMRLRPIAIRPRRTNVYSGMIPAHLGGAGVEFFGVRAYERGDPQHWINWNLSARHPEELYSNEFEQERVADVGIVLDGRLHANVLRQGHSLFEYSVQAAAALADTFLAQGNRVGLLLYGHYLHWSLPGYGRIQRERILQTLARAEPGESMVFADLKHFPTRFFPAHSQIVLVSPLVPADFAALVQLRARGYQLMVISPNPVRYERSYLPDQPEFELAGRIIQLERHDLLNKLQGAGVQVLDWDVRQPLDLAAQAALGRPPAWLRAIGR